MNGVHARTDVIYDAEGGRVYIVAHVPDVAAPAELHVSVAAAATQSLDGLGSATLAAQDPPVTLALRYQPPGGALDAIGLAANSAVAAALTAGAGAALVSSLLAPLSGVGAPAAGWASVGLVRVDAPGLAGPCCLWGVSRKLWPKRVQSVLLQT